MIVVLGSPINVATIILGCIYSMLLSDFLGPWTEKHTYTHFDGINRVFECRCGDKCQSFASIVVFYFYFAMMVSVFLYAYYVYVYDLCHRRAVSSISMFYNVQCVYISLSSTEYDVNIRLAMVWTTIDRLLNTWKSNLSDKIKQVFLEAVAVSILLYGCNIRKLAKRILKKARWDIYKNAACYLDQILEVLPFKITTVRSPASHLTNHSIKTNKTWEIFLEKQARTHKQSSFIDSCTWTC